MTKQILIAGSLVAATFFPVALTPTAAQANYNDKVLVIYGNDKCPAGNICVTAPESERYRIPKTIRDNTPAAGTNNERWASRAASMDKVGMTGPGTCTPSGGGDWTGCWKAQMDAARAERKANKEEAAAGAPQQ